MVRFYATLMQAITGLVGVACVGLACWFVAKAAGGAGKVSELTIAVIIAAVVSSVAIVAISIHACGYYLAGADAPIVGLLRQLLQ